jgi:hypothetical protein
MVKKPAVSKPKPKRAAPPPEPEEEDSATMEEDDASVDSDTELDTEPENLEEIEGEDEPLEEDEAGGEEDTETTEDSETSEDEGGESGEEAESEPEEVAEEVSASAVKKPYPLAKGDAGLDYVPLPPQTKVPEGLLDCFSRFWKKGNKDCEECIERKHCYEVMTAKKAKGEKAAKAKVKPNGAAEAAESDTPQGQKPAVKFASQVVQMLIESKWKAFPKVKRELVDENTFYFQIAGKRRVLVSRAHSNEKFRVRLVNVKEKLATLGADKAKWSKQENNRWLYIGEKAALPKTLRLIFKATGALAEAGSED